MLTPDVIASRLGGSRRERRLLASTILEHVDAAVHYALRGAKQFSESREDHTAEVIAYIYRNDARVLRQWNPDRSNFKSYLKMVARRFVWHRLKGRRTSNSPSDSSDLDLHAHPVDMESELVHRAVLEELLDWVYTKGNAKDRTRFEALFIEGQSATDVAASEGISAEGIYTWASRFRKRAHSALHSIEGEA